MAKTVLITGASGGIGLELARIFAADKNNLVLTARNTQKLEKIKSDLENKYNITVDVITADLSDEKSASDIYSYTRGKNIQVDYLVNNAGAGNYGLFSETEWETERKIIGLNITALTELTKIFLKEMLNRDSGKILNIASVAAFQPGPLMAVYYASKAYVLSFSAAVAREISGSNVSVTVFCPGPTSTGFKENANLEGSGLFKRKNIASAEKAALYGYQAMMKNRLIAIHGVTNRLMSVAVRFLPVSFVTNMVMKISEKRKK